VRKAGGCLEPWVARPARRCRGPAAGATTLTVPLGGAKVARWVERAPAPPSSSAAKHLADARTRARARALRRRQHGRAAARRAASTSGTPSATPPRSK
jgi:hypothetical protein